MSRVWAQIELRLPARASLGTRLPASGGGKCRIFSSHDDIASRPQQRRQLGDITGEQRQEASSSSAEWELNSRWLLQHQPTSSSSARQGQEFWHDDDVESTPPLKPPIHVISSDRSRSLLFVLANLLARPPAAPTESSATSRRPSLAALLNGSGGRARARFV